MSHTSKYFNEVKSIANHIDIDKIENLAFDLSLIRDHNPGRIFVLGIGGSAGNASHMVNDLRKLCGIEAYSPTDNVPELTARTNDEGFETVFVEYLKTSKFSYKDAIFILSVGGGNKQKKVSINLINAIDYVREIGGLIYGIVGKEDGYTAKKGHNVIIVPNVNNDRVTPHSEAFQAVVWHCLVSNPKLQINNTKW